MAYNTIIVKNYLNIFEEAVANATITPGMLIEYMESGKVRAHATSGGNAIPKLFAIEDALQGKEIHDNYAAGDRVRCWTPQPGDMVYAILADGQHVAAGDALESNGAGYLTAHTVETWASADAQTSNTVYSNPIVGIALENKDLSGESSAVESEGTLGTNQRILIRIV